MLAPVVLASVELGVEVVAPPVEIRDEISRLE